MNIFNNIHTFHIPVMGIGYTLDTPVKVAPFGIGSVMSLGDDSLMERLRQFYCIQTGMEYSKITEKDEDHRARRITAYLNLMHELVFEKFEEVKQSFVHKGSLYQKFKSLLPGDSLLRVECDKYENGERGSEFLNEVNQYLKPGALDVNIMTKLDKPNFYRNEQLPAEYNDAHAALRGFAKSKLNSSVVFSAGMNPRLYGYAEQFEDFFPQDGESPRKKIILKVSDYRSALIQGKFLAKKGLWVSEYRIESGLNCGGHAFATQGFLMGPILKEFKNAKEQLKQSVFPVYQKALEEKGFTVPAAPPQIKLTAQGGVGTNAEHEFLLKEYDLDSVGWGSPFLLVPEAVGIDRETLGKISRAKEEDLFLSDASPLGVPFHNLRSATRNLERMERIDKGEPGSPCPKQYLKFNTEFTKKPVCTASRSYQKRKLAELETLDLTKEEYKKRYRNITAKECICGGLGTSVLKEKELDTRKEGDGVSICPGPNMAYFSGEYSLREMIDHIYGRRNIIKRTDRPHMFIKELGLYVDHLITKAEEAALGSDRKELKNIEKFTANLIEGIEYYKETARQNPDFPDPEDFTAGLSDFENEIKKCSAKGEKTA